MEPEVEPDEDNPWDYLELIEEKEDKIYEQRLQQDNTDELIKEDMERNWLRDDSKDDGNLPDDPKDTMTLATLEEYMEERKNNPTSVALGDMFDIDKEKELEDTTLSKYNRIFQIKIDEHMDTIIYDSYSLYKIKMFEVHKAIEFVQSMYNTEKTRTAMLHLKEYYIGNSMLLITARQSFARNMLETFTKEELPFVLYIDFFKELRDREKYPTEEDRLIKIQSVRHLILQMESMHKLKFFPEVLILDECTSVWAQATSPLHKERLEANHIWCEKVVQNALKIICMDAQIDKRCYDVIHTLRPNDKIYFQVNKITFNDMLKQRQNEYNQISQEMIRVQDIPEPIAKRDCKMAYEYNSREEAVQDLFERIFEDRKKIFICLGSKNFGMQLMKMFAKKSESYKWEPRILFLHQKSDDKLLKRMNVSGNRELFEELEKIGNIDEVIEQLIGEAENEPDVDKRLKRISNLKDALGWCYYDVVMITSVITNGIDFHRVHFDACYALGNSISTHFRDFMQMINRVRFLRDNEIYFHNLVREDSKIDTIEGLVADINRKLEDNSSILNICMGKGFPTLKKSKDNCVMEPTSSATGYVRMKVNLKWETNLWCRLFLYNTLEYHYSRNHFDTLFQENLRNSGIRIQVITIGLGDNQTMDQLNEIKNRIRAEIKEARELIQEDIDDRFTFSIFPTLQEANRIDMAMREGDATEDEKMLLEKARWTLLYDSKYYGTGDKDKTDMLRMPRKDLFKNSKVAYEKACAEVIQLRKYHRQQLENKTLIVNGEEITFTGSVKLSADDYVKFPDIGLKIKQIYIEKLILAGKLKIENYAYYETNRYFDKFDNYNRAPRYKISVTRLLFLKLLLNKLGIKYSLDEDTTFSTDLILGHANWFMSQFETYRKLFKFIYQKSKSIYNDTFEKCLCMIKGTIYNWHYGEIVVLDDKTKTKREGENVRRITEYKIRANPRFLELADKYKLKYLDTMTKKDDWKSLSDKAKNQNSKPELTPEEDKERKDKIIEQSINDVKIEEIKFSEPASQPDDMPIVEFSMEIPLDFDNEIVALDIETTALDADTTALNPYKAHIRLLQLKDCKGKIVIIDMFKVLREKGSYDELFDRIKKFKTIIGHNLNFDLSFMAELGLEIWWEKIDLWDTMLTEQIIKGCKVDYKKKNETKTKGKKGEYSYASVVLNHCNKIINKEEQDSEWGGELTDSQLRYAMLDVEYLHEIMIKQINLIAKTGQKAILNLEMNFLKAVLFMQHNGILIDKKLLVEIQPILKLQSKKAEVLAIQKLNPNYAVFDLRDEKSTYDFACELTGQKLKGLTETPLKPYMKMPMIKYIFNHRNDKACEVAIAEFNGEVIPIDLDSTQNIMMILNTYLKLEVKSTNKNYLKKHINDCEFFMYLMDYRKKSNLASKFEGQIKARMGTDNRLHCEIKQMGAETGRTSTSKPNLLGIPNTKIKYGEENDEKETSCRDLFIAGEGNILVISDYSQIELRIVASFCKDKSMIEALQNGQDLHVKIVAITLKKSYEEIMSWKTHTDKKIKNMFAEYRRLGKAINFGLVFGMGAKKLKDYAKINYSVDMTEDEALIYYNAYHQLYKQIHAWHLQTKEDIRGKRLNTVKTMMNRIRNITSSLFNASLNSPIQGTGGDMLKLAVVTLMMDIQKSNLPYKILLTIHDEIIIECPKSHELKCAILLKTRMEEAGNILLNKGKPKPLIVPVIAEPFACRTWGEKNNDNFKVNTEKHDNNQILVDLLGK